MKSRSNFIVLFFCLLSFIATPASADKKTPPPKAKEESQSTKVLWKQWYLLTIAGQAQGYFQEELEKRVSLNQIAMNQRWWEKEEGRTIESFIGSVAEDSPELIPVAFFVERKGQNLELQIDGRKKASSITVRKVVGTQKALEESYEYEKGTIFSTFLPLYLAKQVGSDSTSLFQAVVEDAKDDVYRPRMVKARFKKEKKTFLRNECWRVDLNFLDIESEWWITKEGKLCEMQIPSSGYILQMSTEKMARAAFKK